MFSLLFLLAWLGCQGAVESATGPEEEQVTGSLAQVILVPPGATLSAGRTQQFSAYGRLSEGDSVGVGVTFSATGGTITSQGLYTAGGTPGTYEVVVQEAGGTLSDTSGVTITGGGSTQPLIYSWGFETVGGPRNDRFGQLTKGWDPVNPPENISLVQAATEAARGEWYAQTNNIRTNPQWGKLALFLQNVGQADRDEIYVRFAVQVVNSWANEGFKTLRFFDSSISTLGWLAIQTSGKLQWVFDVGGGPNSHSSGIQVIFLNSWHWIEVQFNTNPGGPPFVKVWVDEVLVIDETHTNPNSSGRLINNINIPSSGPDQGSTNDMWVRFDEFGYSTEKIGIP